MNRQSHARSILIAGLIWAASSSVARADDVQVIVTYENPEVVLPGCGFPFGVAELPPQVNARFVFSSSELPPPGGEASFPTVTDASLVFGNYELTEAQLVQPGDEIAHPDYPGLPSTASDQFHLARDGSGNISELGYGSKCTDDGTARCKITLNHSFQLDLFAEDVSCGTFPENVSHYRYATSRQLVVLVQDSDGDGIDDFFDVCPFVADPDQPDADGDGVGDACDNCKCMANAGQSDRDNDGAGNRCDLLPTIPVGLCLIPPLTIDAHDQSAIDCSLGLGQVCL